MTNAVTPAPALAIHHLSKRYGETLAVNDFSLEIAAGETLALLGPSGCGKSTVLRCVAGLEQPDSGRVKIAGQEATTCPPERRGVGMVFQDYALFPHLSVLDNVAYGLRMRRSPPPEALARARKALALVELTGLELRRPDQLSGGQAQRVALARALATGSPLLLLDEPLSNLDERLRSQLRTELRELLNRTEAAALLVTHDQREALAIASRVAVMRAGQLIQVAPASELFGQPTTAWVAAFLGHENIYPQAGGRALIIPEAALSLGEGDAFTVVQRQPTGSGLHLTLAHTLGPLRLHLSPREERLLEGDSLRLRVVEAAVLNVPDDRGAVESMAEGEAPA